MSETITMPYINDFSLLINESTEQEAEAFRLECRDFWDGNGEKMARDLSWMPRPPSPVTCRAWMTTTPDIGNKRVKRVRKFIKYETKRQERLSASRSIQAEIAKHKSIQDRLQAELDAL